jgi:hypothetical protein
MYLALFLLPACRLENAPSPTLEQSQCISERSSVRRIELDNACQDIEVSNLMEVHIV